MNGTETGKTINNEPIKSKTDKKLWRKQLICLEVIFSFRCNEDDEGLVELCTY